jgi:3-mercaptopyruvate sulfurtransferase SseA
MQNENYPPAKVSFEDFKNLTTEVEPYRNERLLSLDSFLAMRKEENVILLDTRSQNRYERKHIKGAVHLAFTDFTQDKLEEVIPFFYRLVKKAMWLHKANRLCWHSIFQPISICMATAIVIFMSWRS